MKAIWEILLFVVVCLVVCGGVFLGFLEAIGARKTSKRKSWWYQFNRKEDD